ncbi:LacI family DNA-binding transcriptional regulator [Streptomyces sp. NBC_00233]|uniref:LacI family DNA-binding transcriptional regulator n=1 Tax=Streptomyces sp. NBC_00233 TaxID=2975686 RepID=UPI00225729CE|nr:LacI family DNA-binding transcriptional regulator [Streptomyces sp. NBC_00233]MCX5230103.1 LacI family transcriptional regulator [Streptomyces sp. NBC_00233]
MVTLADVARHAGVSASTVSYVLSGKRSISAPTRERIQHSIDALGYRPHAGARALASSRTDILALMMPLRTGLYVPVMMEIAMAVTTTARSHGYDVLLLTGEEGPEAVRRVEGSAIADAMIVMDVGLDDPRLPCLQEAERPAVLIGLPTESAEDADTAGLECVDLDFEAAGARCVEHLAGLGHTGVAVLGEPPAVYERGTGFAARTLTGLRAAAATRGVGLLHRPVDGTYAAVAAAVTRVFEERPGTTALVVQNEAAVEPLLALLRHQGRAVPEDVSVVAICPDQVAVHASVPLTAVSVPAQEMGRLAVERLVGRLAGEAPRGTELIPPLLTARASTGPAPSGPAFTGPTSGSTLPGPRVSGSAPTEERRGRGGH